MATEGAGGGMTPSFGVLSVNARPGHVGNRIKQLPLLVTGGILLVLFATASFSYEGFFSPRVVVNLFADNAFLGIAAIGMTLVIFSGGIDLSVGAVIGFTSIFTATLVSVRGVHPALAWVLAVAVGAALGAGMGTLIQVFRLPAFLITLAGMFLARGAGFWINTESIGITHPWTYAGWAVLVTSRATRSGSDAFCACAIAASGRPWASYQVAARPCRVGTSSGADRSKLDVRRSRKRR